MSKLPQSEYYTLEEACDLIGAGCTTHDLWCWREIGKIDICLLFNKLWNPCLVATPKNSLFNKILNNHGAVTIGLSKIKNGRENPLNIYFVPQSQPLAIFDAYCHGMWKLTDNNPVLSEAGKDAGFKLGVTFFLNEHEAKINHPKLTDETLYMYPTEGNEYKYVIHCNSINRIIEVDDSSKLLPNQPSVSSKNVNCVDSSAHKNRHAAERERILACAIHALRHFPEECGGNIESWFNCINNHNNIYQLEEKDGVISSYVRRILADASNNTPETWKIIGGKK